jgi:hypothetical protein
MQKYSSIFNFQGEVIAMQTEARTERQAWQNFCYGLAKQHGVSKRAIANYFNGTKNNYEIKEEKK